MQGTWFTAIPELLKAVVRLRGARPEVRLGPDELAKIGQPVQLIWGARDVFGSVGVGERAAKVIPDAALHVVAEGGHVPWVGCSDEVAEVTMSFLRTRLSV